jgi:hypothetical protein
MEKSSFEASSVTSGLRLRVNCAGDKSRCMLPRDFQDIMFEWHRYHTKIEFSQQMSEICVSKYSVSESASGVSYKNRRQSRGRISFDTENLETFLFEFLWLAFV